MSNTGLKPEGVYIFISLTHATKGAICQMLKESNGDRFEDTSSKSLGKKSSGQYGRSPSCLPSK